MNTKKVLIIEDEAALIRVMSDKFIREGFDVMEAKNGEEGLNLALQEKPDLILLDIIMPKMDGISMLKAIRQDKWGSKVPIIILSNLSEVPSSKELSEKDISAYLIKSDWSLQDIVKKVKDTLK